jgi:hypothetical protein
VKIKTGQGSRFFIISEPCLKDPFMRQVADNSLFIDTRQHEKRRNAEASKNQKGKIFHLRVFLKKCRAKNKHNQEKNKRKTVVVKRLF